MGENFSENTSLLNVTTSSNVSMGHIIFDDPTQRKIVASSYIVISILGLTGNSFVLLSVLFSGKLHTEVMHL